MIIYKSDVVGWSLLGIQQPFFAFVHDLVLFQIEVPLYYVLKSFGWILQVIHHCKFDVGVSNYIGISLVFLLAFSRSLLTLKPGLIEVYLFTHDNSLDRHQNLQKSRHFGVPVLRSTASPCTQQTQAHLTASIKVRIESNFSVPRRCEVHLGWSVGVAVIEVNIK